MNRLDRRRLSVPSPIAFDASLPIAARRAEIADAIRQHQVIVVCGETGSGKTTQLPKICLELGRGESGMLGHTQPRRIAARSVAARIASELGVTLGSAVGYKVRFTDRSSPDSRLRIMTDGILLAETAHDRLLRNYDTIIIDEAHERSLNIDFLLGYLKTLLPKRPDLKVIITSATIDPQRFSRHFGDAPIIEVSGRTYPVEVRWRPPPPLGEGWGEGRGESAGARSQPSALIPSPSPKGKGEQADLDEDDPKVLEAIGVALDEAAQIDDRGDGDALLILSGEREIREAARFLSERFAGGSPTSPTEILPLYARLSSEEQNRVFQPHPHRRIVLATNVAETSLTVPGIAAVIDPGLARISRYSPHARVQRLPIERISQASAQQRAGRCGRVRPGVCFRLYSQEDFAERPTFTDPEILRSNLASVILQMMALRLGKIEDFPFIDRPRASAIREGLTTLHELGAIDDREQLTALGIELARLPVDPRIGRMILAARKEGCLREVLIITSALTAQDPRLRPLEAAGMADAAHARFVDERSDFIAFLNIWKWWHEQSPSLSSNKLRRLCQAQYLSYVRMREWLDVHRQLHGLAMAHRMPFNDTPARYEQIHRALLAGLLGNVGMRGETFEYIGPSDKRFGIFPGSALFKKGPRWLVAAELVETNRLYARTVARIAPEWIEQLAPHLVKRTHSPPRWNRQSSHVEADQRVTLRGLTIIPRRRVHYAKIDLPLARETFIQHALVEREYQPPPHHGDRPTDSFLYHNHGLIDELSAFENKSRRRDVLIGSEAVYAFYDARLPPSVCNGPSFEKWRRKAERRNPDVLRMQRSDVMRDNATLASEDQFPDHIDIAGLRLPLRYRHDPGHADDGVTMIVPVEALRQVREDRCEWLVPGLLREKIAALIRTLPKNLRVNFVPVPDFAATVAEHMAFGVGRLTETIARELDRSTGVRVPREAWSIEGVDAHLRMNFHVMNDRGEVMAAGRSLDALRVQIGAASSDVLKMPVDERFSRSGLTHWAFDDLPERIAMSRGDLEVFAFPALIDEHTGIGVRLFDTTEAADATHRAGLRRLFVLQVREELAMHVEYLPGLEQMVLHYAALRSTTCARHAREGGHPATDTEGTKPDQALQSDLIDLIADRVFLRDDASVRSEAEFKRRLDAGWDQLWTTSSSVADLVARILAAHHDVDLRLEGATENPFLKSAVTDIRGQMQRLMPARFLVNTPWRWLGEFPRFLNAIMIRLQKLTNAGLKRDHDATVIVAEFWRRYSERGAKNESIQRVEPALNEFRWLIEELRVSLFAQELRTSVPVSAKRLEKVWATIA